MDDAPPVVESDDAGESRAKENDGSHINVPKVLVGNSEAKPPNTLEQGRVYAQLRRNTSFEAKPAIVHFGGFQLGVPHKQKVWLLNISPQPKRANVLQPTTKFFKFNYAKKGMLAMGMAEKITIEFTPTEWRYYDRCQLGGTTDRLTNVSRSRCRVAHGLSP